MFRSQILRRIHDKTGQHTVRDLRILAPGQAAPNAAAEPAPDTGRPTPDAPIKTRETAHPGYQQTLAAALEHRTDPYEEEARRRQIAALRAGRQPESEDREAYWAQQDAERHAGPQPGSMEASIRAAIARKRQDTADGGEPRRLFGAA
ncbi:hypothetical protein SUDANB145_07298 (plasmid) [Streptomyces sp. enrichment culture]